jgi:hypothetical protein
MPAPPQSKPRARDEYRVRNDGAADRTPAPQLVLVKCSLCGTRMHASAEHAGRKIRCPDCETLNTIPAWQPSAATNTAPDLVRGEYKVDAAPPKPNFVTATMSPAELATAVPLPPPPRWPLLRGVYAFPWREGVVIRWLHLTAGIVATTAVLVAIHSILEMYGAQHGSIVAGGSLGIVVFFLSFWTVSFAAACASAIIQETAEGADLIEEWPSLDWREWMNHLLFLLMMLGLAAGVGWGARHIALLSGAGPVASWLTMAVATFLTLPIFWLSALESGSPLLPFSIPVLSSLLWLAWAWLVFYLQAALWLAGLVALSYFLVRWPWALLAVAPAAAAWFFLYARLLGRLGWLIVDRLGASADVG